MSFVAPKRKRFSTDLKMILFASQGWKCNKCRRDLPPTAEVDHYIPLGSGLWHVIDVDPNSKHNLQALCPNCHAAKTMKERIYMPRGSYLPCACGKTHSRYFKPTCSTWTRRFKKLETGVRKTKRATRQDFYKN